LWIGFKLSFGKITTTNKLIFPVKAYVFRCVTIIVLV
jgi:hypothetical protein